MFQNLKGSVITYTLGNRENDFHLYLQCNIL